MTGRDSIAVRFHADENCGISLWRNVVVVDVLAGVGMADIRRMEEATRRHHLAYPGAVLGLTFLRRGIPLGTTEARKEASRVLRDLARDFEGGNRRTVIVIEDEGTTAQLLMTVVRGLFLVAGVRKFVLCGGLDEAADALLPELKDTTGIVSRDGLIDAIGRARAAM
jgi:hypothetical protein